MMTIKNRFRRTLGAFLVSAFCLNLSSAAFACGPYTLDPVFSLTKHADYPLAAYAKGKTGIVPSTFGRMSLFAFYRQLTDAPLSAEEQKQFVDAIERRIGEYESEAEEENPNPAEEKLPDYYQSWDAARAQLAGEKTKVETEKRVPDEYYYFANCLPDAFKNAAKTLNERISLYGTGEHVKEWLKGQDAVFSNCDQARTLPEPAADDYPDWLKKDRQYQIAAAHFYMGDFRAAHGEFASIAADGNSEWRHTARFVAARALIRQSSFIEIPDNDEAAKEQAVRQKNELLQKASDELQTILADGAMRDFHASAKRLFGLVKFRLVPEERRRELGRILAERQENPNLFNDLTDYIWLLETIEEQATARGIEFESKEARAENKEYDYEYRLKIRDVPAAERENDLTDWLFTYQAADGTAHAFEKWKETGKPHWLVAAVVNAAPSAPQISEILSEINKVSPDAPAFPTIRYHQIRLLLETGKRAEARQKLEEAMSKVFTELPVSSQNKLLAQKMSLAGNLEEFLKYAQRKPAAFIWSDDGAERGAQLKNDKTYGVWENRAMFDADAVAFFNEKMPLSELRKAALSPQLPPHLKKFLIVATWTRAFVLDNQPIEREFTPLMQRYAKEFSPHFSKYAAAGGANREAFALITVLRYPVMQPYVPFGFGREDSTPTTIDSIRGNWWCAEAQSDEDRSHYDEYPFLYPEVYPDFLTAEQKAAAAREQKRLHSLGNSATYLARRAVEFANQNPAHPNTPEILHLAVRSTRYGCTDEQTGTYSKQAFQLLHKKYPNNPWTKKTPYWFGN